MYPWPVVGVSRILAPCNIHRICAKNSHEERNAQFYLEADGFEAVFNNVTKKSHMLFVTKKDYPFGAGIIFLILAHSVHKM